MLPQNQIDFSYLSQFEGGSKLIGYIPFIKLSDGKRKSGVTIGCGIDLGQRNLRDLTNLKLSKSLEILLAPYLLRKGEEAFSYLKKNPLVLSVEQAKELNEAVRDHDIGLMIQIFNRFSKVQFKDLPWQAQTVLASLAWNFGPSLDRSIPLTFMDAADQDWHSFGTRLRNFPSKEPALDARRKKEAELIFNINK